MSNNYQLLSELRCQNPLSDWYKNDNPDCVASDILECLIKRRNTKESITYQPPSFKDIPDPALLKDCPAGADLLAFCIRNNKRIVICGDYDVDGVTATALLARFFTKIGFHNFKTFIPDRFKHGYGLNESFRHDILELKPECLITVDNGTNANSEAEFYHAHNIKTIITDHHNPLPDNVSTGILINPKQADCAYPDKELAGVTVGFLLLTQLRRTLRKLNYWSSPKDEPNLTHFLDLVALGTIADQIPLVGLNRILVYHGFKQMNIWQKNQITTAPPYLSFIKTLIKDVELDDNSISFMIAPLLNAAGRMTHADLAFLFLISDNHAAAKVRFQRLMDNNRQRKEKQNAMIKSALSRLDYSSQSSDSKNNDSQNNAIIIHDHDFHEGLIGIVAGHLSSKFKKPALVLAPQLDNCWKASGRSPVGVNLIGLLHKLATYIERYGGHHQAVGFSIKEEKLDSFKTAFYETCKKNIDPEALSCDHYTADIEISPWMITRKLYESLKILAPFGVKNPRPTFLLKEISLKSPNFTNQKVTKWRLNRQTDILLFAGYNERFAHGMWDVCGSLFLQKRGDYSYLQFLIEDLAPSR